ncbi:hypothetical protein AB0F17_35475 [Nonomuraea sp. NPDC026600]|uniref:hypothetical protein n=1 Tax=Nonomuraea sp. NPDC026600 TaxID=3155363 RepID=UPI0033FA45E0
MSYGHPVPVRYEGGPLDGDINKDDYPEDDLREMLENEATFDSAPATVRHDALDVIERYRLERRDGEWVYTHVGTFERPMQERNFTAVFVGGPKDGETTTFLAAMRRNARNATLMFPGYTLRHTGDDILSGWQMAYDAEELEA